MGRVATASTRAMRCRPSVSHQPDTGHTAGGRDAQFLVAQAQVRRPGEPMAITPEAAGAARARAAWAHAEAAAAQTRMRVWSEVSESRSRTQRARFLESRDGLRRRRVVTGAAAFIAHDTHSNLSLEMTVSHQSTA